MSYMEHIYNMIFTLETERLILKVPTLNDYEDLLALRTDPEVMKYISSGGQFDGRIQTKEHVKEHIELAKPYFDKYGLVFYCVFEKKTGRFIGQAGLFHLGYNLEQSEIELAYRLHKQYWGKGYATELAKALIKHGFNDLKLPRIIALVHPDNLASKRVMEKAGMSYYGLIDFRGHQTPCYEILNKKPFSLG